MYTLFFARETSRHSRHACTYENTMGDLQRRSFDAEAC